MAELIAYAKANPRKVSYGSAGVGSSNHLKRRTVREVQPAPMTHVPYKGNAPAMTDVIGGQIAMMFDIISTARSSCSEPRKVRALAVTSRARNPSLPEVPTMSEAGLADYEVVGWYGLVRPGPFGRRRGGAASMRRPSTAPWPTRACAAQWTRPGLRPVDRRAGRAGSTQKAQSDRELWRDVTSRHQVRMSPAGTTRIHEAFGAWLRGADARRVFLHLPAGSTSISRRCGPLVDAAERELRVDGVPPRRPRAAGGRELPRSTWR